MGRKSKESVLEIALTSSWPVSAVIAVGILFFGHVLIPWFFGHSPYLRAAAQALKPLANYGALLFAGIALVKWLWQLKAAARNPLPLGLVSVPTPPRPTTPVRPQSNVVRLEPQLVETPTPTAPPAWSLELIQEIEWKRFEDVCQQFYELKGIRSECTPLGPDGGIDIRLFQDDSDPKKPTAIVQCKAWGSSFVGVKPIRELLGVMVHEKIGKAFFMTSGSYSDEAKAFAAPNRITLIDGKMLLAMFQRLPESTRAQLLEFATAGDYTVPTCPSCGTKMRLIGGREGKRDFWGCSDFPRCRQKLGARKNAGRVSALYE